MIDIKKQYRTRDGREVRIYATDGSEDMCVHGAIRFDGGWASEVWTQHGKYFPPKESIHDLIEVKPRIKREVWVNVYEGEQQAMSWLFINRNLADSAAASCKEARIACVRLTIDCEEGEGL